MTSFFPRMVFAVGVFVLAACSEEPPPDEGDPGCEWVETEVDLEFKPDENAEFSHSPESLLAVLEQPQRGELRWKGGGEWVEMSPSAGTTGVTTQLSYAGGRVVFRRVLDEDGQDALSGSLAWYCPASYEIDAEFRIQTDDAVLDESLGVTLTSRIGDPGTETTIVDPGSFRETLQILESESPPSPVEDGVIALRLVYNTLFPATEFTGRASGTLTYHGALEIDHNGDVVSVSGVSRELLSWRTVPEGSGIPLEPE